MVKGSYIGSKWTTTLKYNQTWAWEEERGAQYMNLHLTSQNKKAPHRNNTWHLSLKVETKDPQPEVPPYPRRGGVA